MGCRSPHGMAEELEHGILQATARAQQRKRSLASVPDHVEDCVVIGIRAAGGDPQPVVCRDPGHDVVDAGTVGGHPFHREIRAQQIAGGLDLPMRRIGRVEVPDDADACRHTRDCAVING